MQCMEVKLGTHVYLSVSMTTIEPRALFTVTTSSLLKLAHHTMRGGETWYACVFQHFHDNHEQKRPQALFSYNYFFTSQTCKTCNAWRWNLVLMCISVFLWQPLTKNGLGHFSLQLLLHFSNLQTMQCMEVKLGTHVYLSVSMTTTEPRALFPITTSSLLKLANHAMHGGETWYSCVFQCFHDNHEQKMAHFSL